MSGESGNAVYINIEGGVAPLDFYLWLCAVSDRFKLVYSKNERPWLMDLKADPEEAFNHFQDPEHASVIRKLTRDLLDYCEIEKDPYGQIPEIQQAMQAALR
ncbi:hypothetical protein N8616_04110 [Verrucomicrobia bacterium]|nr:hypothetical protein [Verrucomicrobiota bacterium]MDA7653754.1 hypothetical protein [Verrucomicrobiota bacterium]MDA7670403.1 hypothetical protein [Verrucomicrobiota bacterium]MDB4691161.1 hypothetical protein [Verrucomicrobiota bacterium]